MSLDEIEIRDDDKCTRCGGACCQIYRHVPPWLTLQEWTHIFHQEFYENPELYGVEPLFDPRLAHQEGNESLLEELQERQLDPFNCQFLGASGCIIDWKRRPEHCKTYKCPDWDLR